MTICKLVPDVLVVKITISYKVNNMNGIHGAGGGGGGRVCMEGTDPQLPPPPSQVRSTGSRYAFYFNASLLPTALRSKAAEVMFSPGVCHSVHNWRRMHPCCSVCMGGGSMLQRGIHPEEGRIHATAEGVHLGWDAPPPAAAEDRR